MAKILVVDDQRNMRTTLAMMLRGAGYEVDEAADGERGRRARARTGAYDVVLTDLRMGAIDGIDVLRAVKEAQPMTEVIVMTAYGTIESAVEAMRLGAFDYIQKPFTEQELLVKVEQGAREPAGSRARCSSSRSEFKERYKFENIVGRSQAVRDVLGAHREDRADRRDRAHHGRERHRQRARRQGHPRQQQARATARSCPSTARPSPRRCSRASSSATRAASFTGAVAARKGLFEEADGGTFFFDEIAETPLAFQAKLLRAIQESEIRRVGENKPIQVDVRIIAATNQDSRSAIAEKRFRQDLYYRLNVARFHLPPLRERREDIPLLVEFFLEQVQPQDEHAARALGEGVHRGARWLRLPRQHPRAREHDRAGRRARAAAASSTIDDVFPASAARPQRPRGATLADVVDDAERQAIEAALRDCDGSRERAAELLGISPTTLWRKMTRLGISFEPR